MRISHLSTIGLSIAATIALASCTPSSGSTSGTQQPSSPSAMKKTEDTMMESKGNPKTAQEKIENAMSAAPMAVAKDAAVMDWPGVDGKMQELRKGSNGWTCLPDYPATPGNDPMCMDAKAMEWAGAWMAKKEPRLAAAGVGYMLQGGSDPSNTDPFAEKPAPGEDWMHAPPHVMIFPAGGKLDNQVYGTNPDTGGPWIMFPDTPYRHLMVPVK